MGHTENQMVDVNLMIDTEVFYNWLKLAKITQEDFAKSIDVDSGNFSKMLTGHIPTPKHVLEKTIGRTLLPNVVIPKFNANKEF